MLVLVEDIIDADDVVRVNDRLDEVMAEKGRKGQILKFDEIFEHARLGDGTTWYAVYKAERKRPFGGGTPWIRRTIYGVHK